MKLEEDQRKRKWLKMSRELLKVAMKDFDFQKVKTRVTCEKWVKTAESTEEQREEEQAQQLTWV